MSSAYDRVKDRIKQLECFASRSEAEDLITHIELLQAGLKGAQARAATAEDRLDEVRHAAIKHGWCNNFTLIQDVPAAVLRGLTAYDAANKRCVELLEENKQLKAKEPSAGWLGPVAAEEIRKEARSAASLAEDRRRQLQELNEAVEEIGWPGNPRWGLKDRIVDINKCRIAEQKRAETAEADLAKANEKLKKIVGSFIELTKNLNLGFRVVP